MESWSRGGVRLLSRKTKQKDEPIQAIATMTWAQRSSRLTQSSARIHAFTSSIGTAGARVADLIPYHGGLCKE